MKYAKNYLNTANLADRISESVAEGKSLKAAGGLGAREERKKTRLEGDADFETIRAGYFNDIRNMFSDVIPVKKEEEELPPLEPIVADESMRFPGAGDYVGYQKTYSAYKSEDSERIKSKLVARGMPEHIAEGFVMNFEDESNLNPLINEKNPTVKGSRGGFGLYQLTGPRRVAYEKFAERQGIDPTNPMEQEDAQLSFLFQEIRGEEKEAWSTIQSASDSGTAAAYVAKYFLRPAEEHLNTRIKKYTGRPIDYTLKPKTRS
jgi:hypothetical protein